MSEEEIKLINETMQLDYSKLAMSCVHLCMENKQLKDQLQQKENIIKEVREYCKNDDNFHILDLYSQDIVDGIQQELLEILDKVKE